MVSYSGEKVELVCHDYDVKITKKNINQGSINFSATFPPCRLLAPCTWVVKMVSGHHLHLDQAYNLPVRVPRMAGNQLEFTRPVLKQEIILWKLL